MKGNYGAYIRARPAKIVAKRACTRRRVRDALLREPSGPATRETKDNTREPIEHLEVGTLVALKKSKSKSAKCKVRAVRRLVIFYITSRTGRQRVTPSETTPENGP